MTYIYAIVDRVSLTHSPLFMEKTDESAKRQFSLFLSGIPHSPADLDLYALGTFCDDTMCIIEPVKAHIANGASLQVDSPPELSGDK